MAIVRTTNELTASTQVMVGGGILTRVSVVTDGTNNAVVTLYDVAAAASAAATNKLDEITVIGANNYGGYDRSHPVRFMNGLYATVSGTGASFFVEYKKA